MYAVPGQEELCAFDRRDCDVSRVSDGASGYSGRTNDLFSERGSLHSRRSRSKSRREDRASNSSAGIASRDLNENNLGNHQVKSCSTRVPPIVSGLLVGRDD